MTRDLPAQFAEFGDARKNGFLKVKEIKDNGGHIVGIFCTFTPSEILDAAGFTPVSLWHERRNDPGGGSGSA